MPNHSAHQHQSVDPSEAAINRWHGHVAHMGEKPHAGPSKAPTTKPAVERPRTVKEAAAELSLSVYTIRAWVACRRLAHIRLGRSIRIPAAELRRVLEENLVPAETE